MTQARRELVSLEATPYYHCISRCVRRAFLCGEDRVSGQSFEHRRQWIVERMKVLSQVFALDVCAYAVMSNHYHLVLRLRPERAQAWSDEEVLARWSELFSGPLLVRRFLSSERLGKAELQRVARFAATYRERLCDLSWFMRCLNESIARRANAEDRCKGRFWEGRFKTQALLDEAAVLSCMAYVDLNPIRAGLAQTPEGSDFTSIQERIRAWGESRGLGALSGGDRRGNRGLAVQPSGLPAIGGLVGAGDPGGQARGDSRAFAADHGAAGDQATDLCGDAPAQ